VALAMAVYLAAVAAVFTLSVNKIDAMPAVSSGTGSGKNILMVGSDSRAGLTPEQQAELTTGAVEGNRTDTIMVMHIPWIGAPTLMSIPRDSYVEIPGYGFDKINAAFAAGGPQLLIQTVEQTTGLRIDDFVEIGLAGIANTTDALGGVRLCPTQNYDDELSGLYVEAGCQLMDGPTALAYVRMRYQDPRGDLGRIERQQEFISATIKRALNPLTWLLPWRAFGAASAAGSSLTVSEGTGIIDLSRLGAAMGMIAVGFGDSTTVPTQEGTYDIGGQNVVLWDEPAAEQLFNSLK
jgi:LCP family protein required for cell wall assembly